MFQLIFFVISNISPVPLSRSAGVSWPCLLSDNGMRTFLLILEKFLDMTFLIFASEEEPWAYFKTKFSRHKVHMYS